MGTLLSSHGKGVDFGILAGYSSGSARSHFPIFPFSPYLLCVKFYRGEGWDYGRSHRIQGTAVYCVSRHITNTSSAYRAGGVCNE